MEESQERTEKRPQTDTDTDVESTQSRQKKGQMKSIFLSDSDKEAIAEFVKQHKELYVKTNGSFEDKQKKQRLWEQLASPKQQQVQKQAEEGRTLGETSSLQELISQHCQEVIRDSM